MLECVYSGAEVETLKGEFEKCAEGTQCSNPPQLSVSSRVHERESWVQSGRKEGGARQWHTDPHHSGFTLFIYTFWPTVTDGKAKKSKALKTHVIKMIKS